MRTGYTSSDYYTNWLYIKCVIFTLEAVLCIVEQFASQKRPKWLTLVNTVDSHWQLEGNTCMSHITVHSYTALYKGGIFEETVPRHEVNLLVITALFLARQSNQWNVLPSLLWENLYGIFSIIWIFFVLKVVKWVWMKLVKLDSTPCAKIGKKCFFDCLPWYKITHLWLIFGLKSMIYMDLFTFFRQF